VTSGHTEYPESFWNLETTSSADKCRTKRQAKRSGIRDYTEDVFWNDLSVNKFKFEPHDSSLRCYEAANELITFETSCGLNNAEEETRQFLLRGSDNHDSDTAVDAASESNGDLYRSGRKCPNLSHRYNSWSADSTEGSYRVTVENQNDNNYDRNFYRNDAAAQHGNNSDNIDDSSNNIIAEGGIANQSSVCLSDALVDIINSLRGGTQHSAATQAPMLSPSGAVEENHCPYGYREKTKQISEKAMVVNSGVNVHVVDVRFLNARGAEEHSSVLADKTSNSELHSHGEYPVRLPHSQPQSKFLLRYLQTERRDSRLKRRNKDEAASRNRNQAEACSPERSTPDDRRSADHRKMNLNISKFLRNDASNGTSLYSRRGSENGRWSVGNASEAADCCVYSNGNSGGSGDLYLAHPLRVALFYGGQSVPVGREKSSDHALWVRDVKPTSKPSEEANGARCKSQHREIIGGRPQAQTESETNIKIRKTKCENTEIKIENDGITDICDVSYTDDSSVEEGGKGERGREGGSREEGRLGCESDCTVDGRVSCSNSELGVYKTECQTNRCEIRNYQETIIEGSKVGDISLNHSPYGSIRLNVVQILSLSLSRNEMENESIEESETSRDSPPVTHSRGGDRSHFSNRTEGPLSPPLPAMNILFGLDLETCSLPLSLPLPLSIPQVQDPLPPLTIRYLHLISCACIYICESTRVVK
jgi:hypothetical protein